MQKLLFIFILCVIFIECNENKQHSGRQLIDKSAYDQLPPKLKYLATLKNYDSVSLYQQNFNSYYETFLNKNYIDSAGACLVQYGFCVNTLGIVDTYFLKPALHFVSQYEQSADTNVLKKVGSISGYIGLQYTYQGNLMLGNTWYKKAIANPYTKEGAVAESKLNLGMNFIEAKQLDSALPNLMAYTAHKEKIKDTINMAVAYLNLSDFYKNLKAYQEFENYNAKALYYATLKQDSFIMSVCHYNKIAATFEQKIDTTKLVNEITSFDKTYAHSRSGNPYSRFKLYSILFEKYNLLGLLDSCQWALQQMDINRAIINENEINNEYKIKAINLEVLQHKPLNNFIEIGTLCQQLEKEGRIREAGILYSKLYEFTKKNNNPKANYYLEQQIRLNNLNEASLNKGKLFELEKKFQTQQKEKTIVEQNSKIQQSKFQITALLFSLLGLSLMAIAYFTYKKRKEAQAEVIRQQKFTDELMQNTEDERKRIATDLHDGVNHELLTLKNKANNGKLIEASEVEKVIHEVRQVSRDLYPAMFDNIGLIASIEALCERMTEAGLFTSCEINYTLKLSKRNELQLYRIIQEALNNTLKHAKADAAKVTIDTVGNELQVEIKDNGIGFDTNEKMNSSSSFGIQSLMQRARAIGGKSTIESNETGTKLILKTPIH